jgi:aminopeptidase N
MPESVLDTESVYLDKSSAWVPDFAGHPLYTFRLHVKAPQDWQIISQGKRSGKHNDGAGDFIFDMPQPQDDIYLIAGPYQRFSKQHNGIEIVVYLYDADTTLAEKYLQTSADYIDLYSDWVGSYPYAKFAIVENRWQTGYGMPSFTLLGSTVIRLPFILSTSLPHEILHNWWGNGVYIDFSKGNWSEGLTAYMSDHFSSEKQGKGSEYRRKALERYANFAAAQGDFALTDFSSRHDEASQAIGYSKSLMLFHMLRTMAGDDSFSNSIRQFWQHYQFKYANFPDVIQQLYPANDTNSNIDYRLFTEQWLNRTGAPEISLDNVSISKRVDKQNDGYLLSIKISQQQQGPAYQLQIPLEVTLQGKTQTVRENILLTEKNNLLTFYFKQQPQAVTLDPDYDVFRLLHANERPATLGRLFGAKKQLLVLPAKATAEQIKAWQQLAAAWSRRYKNVELAYDIEIKALPDGVAAWLLGWNNELLKDQQHYLTSTSQQLTGNTVTINRQHLHADEHAVVLLDADNSRTPLAFIGADDPEAIALMARKLPHYSSYGVLAFELPEVKNIIKQHLPVLNSPMTWKLDQ